MKQAKIPGDLPKYPRRAFGLDDRPDENYTSYEIAIERIARLEAELTELRNLQKITKEALDSERDRSRRFRAEGFHW